MSIPFPNPTTRSEARDNAIYLAKVAEERLGIGEVSEHMIALSGVWSGIADTFPWDPEPMLSDEGEFDSRPMAERNGFIEEDHRPYPAEDTAVIVPDESDDKEIIGPSVGSGTWTVDPASWDVLRFLAACYLHGTGRRITIDLDQIRRYVDTYDIVLIRDKESSTRMTALYQES